MSRTPPSRTPRGWPPSTVTASCAAAAVGVTGDWKERAAMLVDHGVDALVVDVAHRHARTPLVRPRRHPAGARPRRRPRHHSARWSTASCAASSTTTNR
ncbi:IMP dehydrogenase [Streptomyces sp. NPDC057445]|uniref:IMP dehydrogenase n=1 Tax=Streptomyces sp. NPDC057445 TaxID=3346136 RepID=UPI003690E836